MVKKLIGLGISLCLLVTFSACLTTSGQKGALGGAGVGALAGQVIGGNTSSTLIGTGIGMGLGYIIGNEMDKKKAQERSRQTRSSNYSHNETGNLGGTRWNEISINPKPKGPERTSVVIEFKRDGHLITTTTFQDGTVDVEEERYRVVGNSLIINNPGYMVNARHRVEGNRLIIDTEGFGAVYQRL